MNIALIAETDEVAHASGVSAAEVTEAAATKPFGYFPFYPGSGVGGHCLVNDLGLLPPSPLFEVVRALIDEMPAVAVDRLATLLALPGKRVLVVGTGYKPGSSEQTASPASGSSERFALGGAIPWFVDSGNASLHGRRCTRPRGAAEMLGTFDAAIIVSGDDAVTAEDLRRAAPVVLDAAGGAGGRRGCEGSDRQPSVAAEARPSRARWDGSVQSVRPLGGHDFETDLMFIDYVEVPPGATIGYHRHGDDEELYFIIEGAGVMEVEGVERRVHCGDLILNRRGSAHSLVNDSSVVIRLLVLQVRYRDAS